MDAILDLMWSIWGSQLYLLFICRPKNMVLLILFITISPYLIHISVWSGLLFLNIICNWTSLHLFSVCWLLHTWQHRCRVVRLWAFRAQTYSKQIAAAPVFLVFLFAYELFAYEHKKCKAAATVFLVFLFRNLFHHSILVKLKAQSSAKLKLICLQIVLFVKKSYFVAGRDICIDSCPTLMISL